MDRGQESEASRAKGRSTLCRFELFRHAPDKAVVAFFRFFDATGACIESFPFRLDKPRVDFDQLLKIDPSSRCVIDCAEPDAQIDIRIIPCDFAFYARRALNHLSQRFTTRPPPPRTPDVTAWQTPANAPAYPLVSIIIPTRDKPALLARAVETLFEMASWPHKQLVIIDNGSVEAETFSLLAHLAARDDVIVLRRDEPFNFSKLVNAGAQAARGEILAFLNNDVETQDRDWIQKLAPLALDRRVGALGIKLLEPNGVVQHAGITLGVRGLTGHAGRGRRHDDPGPGGMLTTTRQVSAVTGACLLTRRDVFDALGGFDEEFVVEMNDVDYCLRVREANFDVVFAAQSVMTHAEGFTRRGVRVLRSQEILDRSRFVKRWGQSLVCDPYYPPGLTLLDESLSPAPPD